MNMITKTTNEILAIAHQKQLANYTVEINAGTLKDNPNDWHIIARVIQSGEVFVSAEKYSAKEIKTLMESKEIKDLKEKKEPGLSPKRIVCFRFFKEAMDVRTERAQLIKLGNVKNPIKVWLPLSQIEVTDDPEDKAYNLIKLPFWLYFKSELPDYTTMWELV